MSKIHSDQTPLRINLNDKGSNYAILALHGRNQSPEYMHDILKSLDWDSLPAILPAAAEQSWYPGGFMDPLDVNSSKLEESLQAVKKFHLELRQLGYPDDRIIMMGFSQGACLAAQYCLQNPNRFKAIFILTGGYIGPKGIDWQFEGDFQQTPGLITSSEIDEWVPPQRTRETAEQFSAMNANLKLKIYENREHAVSEDEIQIMKSTIDL